MSLGSGLDEPEGGAADGWEDDGDWGDLEVSGSASANLFYSR